MSSSGTPRLPVPAAVPTRMAWSPDGDDRPRQLAVAVGRFLRRPLALTGLVLITGLVLLALFPELFASANWLESLASSSLLSSSAACRSSARSCCNFAKRASLSACILSLLA